MVGRLSSRLAALVAGLVLLAASGCTGDADGPQRAPAGGTTSTPPATRTAGPDVVDFVGLREIRFGESLADLSARGVITTAKPYCGSGYSFAGIDAASPVLDRGQLVLIWAYPPLHTPENVLVGTPVEQAKTAYPAAVELNPPAGSTTYPGLLVIGGDRAYLLLHDGRTVQKLVVGFERYARLLYDTGFGTC